MCDFPSKNGPMSNFFKTLLAGLTNQHDISDSFAVTPLERFETHLPRGGAAISEKNDDGHI